MPASFLRSVFRRLPPVARRDATITRLRQRVKELSRTNAALERSRDLDAEQLRDHLVEQPSFQARIHAERRLRNLAVELGAPSTSVIRHGKLHVYDLARSHGIETPVEYGRWDDPRDIRWSDLPDAVVIKSAFASNSRGVLPLLRSGDGWRILTTTDTMSDEQVSTRFAAAMEQGRARPPFVAEELLDEDGTGTRLPTDVKVYVFYGEVPMVVLRRPGRWGEDPLDTPFRVIDARGGDVEGLETESLIDTSMPVPATLDEIVAAATRLSVALRVPFSRIDFYSIGDRVVFGEVTPRPGGSAWHGPVVDLMLGRAWERAEVRLARDLAEDRFPAPEVGPIGAS